MAMLVPCAALVLLTLGMIRQDRELANRRREFALDQMRLRLKNDIGKRLDKIKLDESDALPDAGEWPLPGSYRHPSVALLARIEEHRLVLPWGRNLPKPARDLKEGPFGALTRDGQTAEFSGSRLDAAVAFYRRAASVATTPHQRAYAAWLEARAVAKMGGTVRAARMFTDLLKAPPGYTDEDAVPLAVYAAGHLLRSGVNRKAALQGVLAATAGRSMLASEECYLISGMLARVPGDELAGVASLQARVAGQQRLMGQAENLVRAHAGGLRVRPGLWANYGGADPSPERWLVSTIEHGSQGGIIALRAADVLGDVERDWQSIGGNRVRLTFEGEGDPLGGAVSDLRALFETPLDGDAVARDNARRQLFYVALVVLVGATMFGASLLWRDLQREVRTAELRTQFASSVSHELKTPLTAIRMFAETLQLRRTADESTRDEYLATIVYECERLTRLVEDILAFSKIEQGIKKFRFEPVRLDYVIHSALRALQYPMTQHGFNVKTDVADGDSLLRADRDSLEQAVLNLLANAMKYSGKSREIGIDARRDGSFGVISIIDRGIGIAPADQARIFDKYYRVQTRENELVPGAGLGLALVAHIARAHGGRVTVESVPEHGSTFRLLIPLEETV